MTWENLLWKSKFPSALVRKAPNNCVCVFFSVLCVCFWPITFQNIFCVIFICKLCFNYLFYRHCVSLRIEFLGFHFYLFSRKMKWFQWREKKNRRNQIYQQQQQLQMFEFKPNKHKLCDLLVFVPNIRVRSILQFAFWSRPAMAGIDYAAGLSHPIPVNCAVSKMQTIKFISICFAFEYQLMRLQDTYRHLLSWFHYPHDRRFDFVLTIFFNLATCFLVLWFWFTFGSNRLNLDSENEYVKENEALNFRSSRFDAHKMCQLSK